MLDKLKQLFTPAAGAGVASITPQEAHAKLGQKGVVMIDVREPDEYRVGHVKGARLMPLSAVGKRWQELRDFEEVIVICRSGNRSTMACRQLVALGLANVSNLSGGILGWANAKLPIQH